MASNTPNYSFVKPDLTDQPDIRIPNPNWDILDSELKDHSNKLGSLSQFAGNVKLYGGKGDGVTPDDTAITTTQSTGDRVVFTKGSYLINADKTFNSTVYIFPGAVLKIRNGAKVTFNGGIEAGWYTIFDTTDDFITDLTANTSVIIKGCPVKADWFASKVLDFNSIKTIPDQTNNLTKAYRAATGNWAVSGSNYKSGITSGVLELGIGYYRTDQQFALSKIVGGTTYYRVSGFRLTGQGDASSYLVRTNMAATDYGIYALFTGELTNIDNFKYTCYNPDGVTNADKYSSASKALLFLQGDSLQLSKVWVSGAQVSVTDSNGVKRNGVGIQFSSCTDTWFSDVFVELCVTGIAFGSSIVSGTNLELYGTIEQAIGLGVFDSAWADTQTTSSTVNIVNIQANASNRGIMTLENGDTGECNLLNVLFDGYKSEDGSYPGTNFVEMKTGTSLKGGIINGKLRNFRNKTFSLGTNCSLGRAGAPYFVNSIRVEGQTLATSGGVFYLDNTGTFANVSCVGLGLLNVAGVLLAAPRTGKISIEDVFLSGYVGQIDASANRQLFNTIGTADITLREFKRDTSDGVALNQFGYATGGNIFIDIDSLYNATRTVSGTGATVKMPAARVAFA